MGQVELRNVVGGRPPVEVARLRYEQYVHAQGKPYPSADHERRILYDDLDSHSTHLMCYLGEDNLLSSLRLTPFEIASGSDYFKNLMDHATSDVAYSVLLSRLVRNRNEEAAASVQLLFKRTYDYCREQNWAFGLISTSPKLVPLFFRYGWREAGPEYRDDFAGAQIPLYLDTEDRDYLKRIASPYLTEPVRNGRQYHA